MLKRIIVMGVLALALVGVGLAANAPEADALPKLKEREAVKFSMRALKREFGSEYTNRRFKGQLKPVFNCDRKRRAKMTCSAEWFRSKFEFQGAVLPKFTYFGRITIWFTRKGQKVFWNFAFKIRRVDEPCAISTNQVKGCTRTFIVK